MAERGRLRFTAAVLGTALLWFIVVPAARAHVLPGVPGATQSTAQEDPSDSDGDPGRSPARCGPDDAPEPGIQGDVPLGETGAYNCGLTLVGELPISGPLQGSAHCAYVRSGDRIRVIDVSDPANPTEIGSVPTFGSSETMRAVVTDERALLVSGAGVYDISDCENPVVLGEIDWTQDNPTLAVPHDVRISHDATKVYASVGTIVADISNLDDPGSWTVRDHTCDVSAQYHPVYAAAAATTGDNLVCESLPRIGDPFVRGQQSHGPDDNGDGSRFYIGSVVAFSAGANPGEDARIRILDMTQDPPKLMAEIDGPGHSIDWFRIADGREFLLHSAEIVYTPQTSCMPHPRPSYQFWAHNAFLTEVTNDTLRKASLVELAISKSEHCQAKLASGQNTDVSYHRVDDPFDAHFAMVSMGNAGLRVFDIRNPDSPVEVAYFNHGPLVHAGVTHYDAKRGLIYAPVSSGFRVLQLQPQVIEHLGLREPRGWQAGDRRPPWAGPGQPEVPGRPR